MKILSRKRIQHQNNRGVAFLFVVFILTLISVAIVTGFAEPNIRELQSAQRDNVSNDAFLFAEAGNEDAFYRLRTGKNVPNEVVYTLNGRRSTTTVTTIDASTQEITSEGAIGSNIRKSKLRVSNQTTAAELLYGAQIGIGGAFMANNAEIKGVLPAVGSIYSGGSITGDPNSLITGDVFISTSIVQDTTASHETNNQDRIVGQADPQVDFAQSFVPTNTNILNRVELLLAKEKNPNSRTVYIVLDNAGQPGATVLTSGTLDKNKVLSTFNWVSIPFFPQVTLNSGQTYWIVLDAQRNNSNYWYWKEDSAAGYTSGAAMYSEDWDDDPWTGISPDLTFRTFFGEGESSIDSIGSTKGDVHADAISNTTVEGDAYYKTLTSTTVLGNTFPDSPTPLPLDFPFTDDVVNNWIAVAEAGGTISGDYAISGTTDDLGPTKVDGDLMVEDDGGDGVLNVTGTVYVTGTITTDNNAEVRCDVSYGDTSCILIADGYVDIRNNNTFVGSGDPKSFILVISRLSGCNGGAQTSSCTSGNSAIYFNNNAVTGAIFYAPSSQVKLENGASVSSVIADKLHLENTAAVVYDTDLQDLNFASGGGGGGWLVEDWREVE